MGKSIAVKRSPRLWDEAKRAACTHAKLCKHSARKMQWATTYYKAHGGTYASPKRSEDNSLVVWTRQKWRTHSGTPSRGKRRYLPDAAWKRLSPAQVRRTNRAKRRGWERGEQWVPQPADVRRAAAAARRRA